MAAHELHICTYLLLADALTFADHLESRVHAFVASFERALVSVRLPVGAAHRSVLEGAWDLGQALFNVSVSLVNLRRGALAVGNFLEGRIDAFLVGLKDALIVKSGAVGRANRRKLHGAGRLGQALVGRGQGALAIRSLLEFGVDTFLSCVKSAQIAVCKPVGPANRDVFQCTGDASKALKVVNLVVAVRRRHGHSIALAQTVNFELRVDARFLGPEHALVPIGHPIARAHGHVLERADNGGQARLRVRRLGTIAAFALAGNGESRVVAILSDVERAEVPVRDAIRTADWGPFKRAWYAG